MADEHEQPEREWDEYEWERFLQNQELRTERYLELFEQYVDHPERAAGLHLGRQGGSRSELSEGV
jgi:hypothetical protein